MKLNSDAFSFYLKVNACDPNGCFSKHLGKEFAGLSIFNEGTEKGRQFFLFDAIKVSILYHHSFLEESIYVCVQVLEMLRRRGALLKAEKHMHQYPCDWRTKLPLVVRLSRQWFINIESLRPAALVSLNLLLFQMFFSF